MREGASLLGVLLAGAVLAAGPRLGWTGGESQVAVGMLAIALGAPALAAMLWAVPEIGGAARQGPGRGRSATSLLAGLHRNRPFLRLIAAWFLTGSPTDCRGAVPALSDARSARGRGIAGRAHLCLFRQRRGGHSALAAAQPAAGQAPRVVARRCCCAAAAFAVVPFIAAGDWPVFLAVCVVTGAALGADLALPPAMQADLVDYDAWKFGRPRAGILFALWSMASKLALAASVGIAFPVLDLLGFDAQAAVNTPQALLGLAVIYALVPVVIKVMTVALVWGHPLTERRHASIRRRLAQRP